MLNHEPPKLQSLSVDVYTGDNVIRDLTLTFIVITFLGSPPLEPYILNPQP